MKLSELKQVLSQVEALFFQKEDGTKIPTHFHITEVGKITKSFIDCGGKVRQHSVVNLQLWESVDVWHRLTAEKLLSIIALSESKLQIADDEIEVEYQGATIEKYGLRFENGVFILTKTQTDCLAQDKCGIPELVNTVKEKVSNGCTPGGGCC
jgi:hypothetical protein